MLTTTTTRDAVMIKNHPAPTGKPIFCPSDIVAPPRHSQDYSSSSRLASGQNPGFQCAHYLVKAQHMRKALPWKVSVFIFSFIAFISVSKAYADESSLSIIRQGLLGAATGAISAEASGGKAGKGALIGVGTNVIGGALFDVFLSGGSSRPAYASVPAPAYSYSQPIYYSNPQSQVYYVQEPVYTPPPQPVYRSYAPPPQEDPNKRIIKQGLLGAATGALSAEMSGGKAGKGALIGAGTNVIGGALLDTLFSSPSPSYSAPYSHSSYGYPSNTAPKKKIVRHYDAQGRVTSEEEYWL